MKNTTYLYELKVMNSFNIFDFDTCYRRSMGSVVIKEFDGDIHTDNLPFIRNRISTIYYNSAEKLFVYNTGSIMKVNKDAILIDYKNDVSISQDVDKILLYRLVTCAGLTTLLRFRNNIILHGSALQIGKYNYAVIGKSGRGKSTLLAYLLKYSQVKLISDDKIIVDANTNLVKNGSSVIRLWPDTISFIDKRIIKSINKSSLYNEKKFIEIIDEKIQIENKLKLNRVIILNHSDEIDKPNLQKIEEDKLYMYLLSNIYDYDTLSKTEVIKEIAAIKKIFESVEGYILNYKHNYNELERIFQLIINFGG